MHLNKKELRIKTQLINMRNNNNKIEKEKPTKDIKKEKEKPVIDIEKALRETEKALIEIDKMKDRMRDTTSKDRKLVVIKMMIEKTDVIKEKTETKIEVETMIDNLVMEDKETKEVMAEEINSSKITITTMVHHLNNLNKEDIATVEVIEVDIITTIITTTITIMITMDLHRIMVIITGTKTTKVKITTILFKNPMLSKKENLLRSLMLNLKKSKNLKKENQLLQDK